MSRATSKINSMIIIKKLISILLDSFFIIDTIEKLYIDLEHAFHYSNGITEKERKKERKIVFPREFSRPSVFFFFFLFHRKIFFDVFFYPGGAWRDDQTPHRAFCSTYERPRSTTLKETTSTTFFIPFLLNIHLLMKNHRAVP